MRILVIGAAGMIGRKLTERLVRDGRIGGKAIAALTLHDVVEPSRPDAPFPVTTCASDLSEPSVAEDLVADEPDLVFHLAAIVSGEAEADLEKGTASTSTARACSSMGCAGARDTVRASCLPRRSRSTARRSPR